jgi:hypothetical protein
VAYHDPRLLDATLLRLAAYRLTHGPPPPPPWQETEGLCALLDYARHLPARGPADLEAGTGPFAQMLKEARAWVQAEREGEAC